MTNSGGAVSMNASPPTAPSISASRGSVIGSNVSVIQPTTLLVHSAMGTLGINCVCASISYSST